MLEWPGRCSRCGGEIEEWADAGLHKQRWIHKACFNEVLEEASRQGGELPELRPPTDRGSQLELPMLAFLLLFHFGLGMAVIGWILLTQDGRSSSDSSGAVLLALGLVAPLIGIVGIVRNIISRRRVELVRREIDQQGGWRPGR